MRSETPSEAASAAPVAHTRLPFARVREGKVRDVYDLGDALLLVATDRVSAFDVVLTEPVPRKGEVLTLLSAWWFAQTRDIVANHLLTLDPDEIAERYPALAESRQIWQRRSMLVRKLRPFPVECVVRGYLAGSGWTEYARTGTLAGEPLPPGLHESDRLPAPVFSPATKAEAGHDENITFQQMTESVGADHAARLRDLSLRLYEHGRRVAAEHDILLADTKFEFGHDEAGGIVLIDEVLTPDSSRFWPAASYRPGGPQPSLDKQPVRDHLESLTRAGRWDKRPPPPALPAEVVAATSARYQEVFVRLTGTRLDDFPLTWRWS